MATGLVVDLLNCVRREQRQLAIVRVRNAACSRLAKAFVRFRKAFGEHLKSERRHHRDSRDQAPGKISAHVRMNQMLVKTTNDHPICNRPALLSSTLLPTVIEEIEFGQNKGVRMDPSESSDFDPGMPLQQIERTIGR